MEELEGLKSKAKSDAYLRAKIAEAEGKLTCTSCDKEMVPNEDGVYEFEEWQGGAPRQQQQPQVIKDKPYFLIMLTETWTENLH